MKKRLIVDVLFVLFLMIFCQFIVQAAEEDAIEVFSQEEINVITEDINSFIVTLDNEIQSFMPKFDVEEIISTEGSSIMNLKVLFKSLLDYIFKEVKVNLVLLGQLLIVGVLGSLLSGLIVNSSANIAETVCRIAAIGIGINAFRITLELVSQVVSDMVSFTQGIIPALSTTLIATGAAGSATLITPLMLTMTSVLSTAVKVLIIPLVIIVFVLKVTNTMSGTDQLSKLASLFQTIWTTILGLIGTVFVGILGIRGGFTSVSDALTAKTAKFLTGNFVPVIGKVFADSLDMVAASAALIKGAVGAFGLVAIIVITLFPLAKIFLIMISFRLASALIQPLGDSKISISLSDIADVIQSLAVCVLVISLMFFLSFALVINIGNVAASIR